MKIPKTDFKIGGGWGDSIQWSNPEKFEEAGCNRIFRVYGFKSFKRPKIGNRLLGEFRKSCMIFEFVNIEWQNDPSDMFFANVRLIARFMKDGGPAHVDDKYCFDGTELTKKSPAHKLKSCLSRIVSIFKVDSNKPFFSKS